jgi:hypothetical protein
MFGGSGKVQVREVGALGEWGVRDAGLAGVGLVLAISRELTVSRRSSEQAVEAGVVEAEAVEAEEGGEMQSQVTMGWKEAEAAVCRCRKTPGVPCCAKTV